MDGERNCPPASPTVPTGSGVDLPSHPRRHTATAEEEHEEMQKAKAKEDEPEDEEAAGGTARAVV